MLTLVTLEELAIKYPHDESLSRQIQILRFVMRAGKEGCCQYQIRMALNFTSKTVNSGLSYYVEREKLFARGPDRFKVYFGNKEWADDWVQPLNHVSHMHANRILNKADKKWTDEQRKMINNPTVVHKKKEIKLEGPSINNGVSVTKIPTPVDYRFHVPHTHVGEFSVDWQNKRMRGT